MPYLACEGKIAVASGSESAGRMVVRLLWDNSNTVVDGNGFIKQSIAGCQVLLIGGYETNDESEDCGRNEDTRLAVPYRGVHWPYADAAWGEED